jgi:orotidine-5'-phosphate decarboxylase
MNFVEKLAQSVSKNESLLCVGLDPDPALMPEGIGVFEFNKAIIDATSDLVCAYKPNFAFYEAQGREGLDTLEKTISYIPDSIVKIGDAKRGDIGNTSKAYAKSIFDYYGCDAVTVSPYLGFDSIEPFVQYHDRGIFVLCRTSNQGAKDFQSLQLDIGGGRKYLYEIIAEKVSEWNVYSNMGLVVGATYPEELKLIRKKCPAMPLLIPGVGAQGGELDTVIKYGADSAAQRTIINSSRQILYASKGKDFAEAARQMALSSRKAINSCLATR